MAQQNNFGKIGISYSSFGTNDLIYFEGLDGAPTYNSNNFFVFGFNYLYPLNNWLEFETCIEYAKHRITVEPNLPPGYNSSPYTDDFSLLEIPLGIRINFLQFFFLNTGIFVDMNVSQSSSVYSQSGIGVMGGIAAKYDFKFRLSVFVNPYIKAHSLIAFEKDNHQLHLMETGFRFGITYTLIKNKER
jgi:hypothetical protein